jgi:protoporphyrinogen oxidase
MRFAVIGAGMLGLTLAYRLRQAGHAVTVFESAAEPGGQTGTFDGARQRTALGLVHESVEGLRSHGQIFANARRVRVCQRNERWRCARHAA